MTFSYAHTANPTTAKIRLLIGDTNRGSGPRPTGKNFSDEEIDVFLSMEGSHAMRAAAAALETLSVEWSTYAGQFRTGPVDEDFQQAAAYADRATAMRSAWGYAEDQGETGKGFSVTTTR